ncbi:MAG: putative hemolysin [Bacteroidetes bacterium]|nr:putative hemolysin [Bacteroidota bacterium]
MTTKRYTAGEELANSLSHGVGILLGLLAGYFLLQKAQSNSDPWAVGCVLTYLFGMLASYITSTWYHSSRPGKRKEILRKADHAAIYWHIAGTYTPFTLLVMRDAAYWGWGVFAFVWMATIAGSILSFKKLKEHSNLETACFVGMGSAIFVAMKPLADCLQSTQMMPALWWLIGGGISYIVGALFYSFRKVKYMHSVFHLFCLGGSICHIISIWIIL